MKHDNLFRAEQLLADNDGSKCFRGTTACISNNLELTQFRWKMKYMTVAFFEAECWIRVNPRVHTCDNDSLSSRGKRQISLVERLDVFLVSLFELFCCAHIGWWVWVFGYRIDSGDGLCDYPLPLIWWMDRRTILWIDRADPLLWWSNGVIDDMEGDIHYG